MTLETQGGGVQLRDAEFILSKAATVLHFAISVATLGFTQAVVKAMEPYLAIGQIVLLTAPLTAAAAIIAGMLLKKSFRRMDALGIVFVVVATIVLPYVIAEYFGLVLPIPGGASALDALPFISPGRSFGIAGSIIRHYFTLYGLVGMFLSVLCGVYLAWVWTRGIGPRLRAASHD